MPVHGEGHKQSPEDLRIFGPLRTYRKESKVKKNQSKSISNNPQPYSKKIRQHKDDDADYSGPNFDES